MLSTSSIWFCVGDMNYGSKGIHWQVETEMSIESLPIPFISAKCIFQRISICRIFKQSEKVVSQF